ncbi:MAG: hypothetical protein ACC662_05975, partial [Planctomycetota bacterium]
PAARSWVRRRPLGGRAIALSVAVHVVLLAGGVALILREASDRQERVVALCLTSPTVAESVPADPRAPPSPWLAEDEGRLELPLPDIARVPAGASPQPGVLEPLDEHRYDFPPRVLGPMRLRTVDALKRGRLQGLGLDAQGTLKAVARGLSALALRQRADGSFAPGGERSAVGETALALLPFLGEGNSSRTGPYAEEVVRPGVGWLRARLFAPSSRAGGNDADPGADVPVAERGMALKALSEDFMLSYGRLTPREASRRSGELARLTTRVAAAQAPDGSFPGAGDDIRLAVWPMWGLDAVARTGAAVPPAAVAERFAAWFEHQARDAPETVAVGLLLARDLGRTFAERARAAARARPDAHEASRGDPFLAVTLGTGLLLQDPEAFRTWSRGVDRHLIARLRPTGLARRGDPVGDTALILLSLQIAYRTY